MIDGCAFAATSAILRICFTRDAAKALTAHANPVLMALALFAGCFGMTMPAAAGDGSPAGQSRYPDASLIAGIGAAARASAAQIPDPNARLQILTSIAANLIEAGDLAGARAALADAKKLGAGVIDQQSSARITTLSIHAGDDAAFALIPKKPAGKRLEALVWYAEAKAKEGHHTVALKLLTVIERELTALSRAENYNPLREQLLRDKALSVIGSALAAGGHPEHAVSFSGRMRFTTQILVVLQDIALAQHRAGDMRALSETRAMILAALNDPARLEAAEMIVEYPARALVLCGDMDGARQAIGLIDHEPERKSVFGRVALAVARAGDIAHAREMAGAGSGEIGAPEAAKVWAAIAMVLADKGDFPAARRMLAEARDAILSDRSLNRSERVLSVINILDGQLATSAFPDAMQTSAAAAPLKLPVLARQILEEAAGRNDEAAIREAMSAVLREAEESPPSESAVKNLTQTAKKLGESGHNDEAGTILGTAEDAAGKLTGAEKAASLEMIKQARSAIASPPLTDAFKAWRIVLEGNRGGPRLASEAAKSIAGPAERAGALSNILLAASRDPLPPQQMGFSVP